MRLFRKCLGEKERAEDFVKFQRWMKLVQSFTVTNPVMKTVNCTLTDTCYGINRLLSEKSINIIKDNAF